MNISPRISVIVINNDHKKDLKKTLISIANQVYSATECLIVSNNSIIADKSELTFDKIFNFIISESSEVNIMFELAISCIKGEYVFVIKAGDCLHNQSVIATLVNNLDANIGIVYGNMIRRFPDGKIDISELPDILNRENTVDDSIDYLPVSLIRTNLFNKYNFFDKRLSLVKEWAFLIKAVLLDSVTYKYVDTQVAEVAVNRVGKLFKLSDVYLINKEKSALLDNRFFKNLPVSSSKIESDRPDSDNIITKISDKTKSSLKLLTEPLISNFKYQLRSIRSRVELAAYKKKYTAFCFDIPIIINNRNHLTYLKKLITSLEDKGYHNIFIIDNDSTYSPLKEYYSGLSHKVFYLGENVGFCALWETDVFDMFKDQYYVYTDSDLEIIKDCPDDFMVIMHYLINKYSLGKVGLSLLTDDLPDHYVNKKEVIQWESKFSQKKIDSFAYNALVDTTFALYKPNCFGYSGLFPSFRTVFPYSARHLPWYENSKQLTDEQLYYYNNVKTSSHWSIKALEE